MDGVDQDVRRGLRHGRSPCRHINSQRSGAWPCSPKRHNRRSLPPVSPRRGTLGRLPPLASGAIGWSETDGIAPEEYRRATEVTYLGYVHGTMAALKRMKPRDRGTIVQVGSALAYRSIPLQSPYCGAKAAIRAFTDSLRCELLHDRSHVRLTVVHLPAVNTPQFDWALARMPGKPRPVAPVYQPELAARAIVWAVGAGRREVLLGPATVLAIWANKFAPGLLDRYLARTNYQAQQRSRPASPAAPANLFQTVRGAHRTRGSFDDEAREGSLQWTLSRHRRWLAAGAVALGLAALALSRPGRAGGRVRPTR
ncbi:MAG: SDR family NAD(P)-dependent oxidoreductase [Alphaproteobacteria bacterium]|nr:SDR family NAD(P)-dependent oxidoreductase [Alphaproteobacteria bacterium]